MSSPFRQRLTLYQYIAGICDGFTGLLMVGFPGFTLSLLGLTDVPGPYARFIGVFVLSVGLTYLWTVIRWPLTGHAAQVWLTQWKITALIRLLVALFLLWQVASHSLQFRWMTVSLTDGLFAAIQIIGLEQGWIERAA